MLSKRFMVSGCFAMSKTPLRKHDVVMVLYYKVNPKSIWQWPVANRHRSEEMENKTLQETKKSGLRVMAHHLSSP